jgi:hypothetical protein
MNCIPRFATLRLVRHFACLLAVATFAAHAEAPAQPYTVEVWARVLFDTQGRVAEYALVDEAQYPAQFAANVKERVAKAKIEPPQDDGKAVTLRSGVRLNFLVTPAAEGGSVKIVGLSMGPIPTYRYYVGFPKDVSRSGGWEGEVQALCKVGAAGRCTAVEVTALPGIPESVRRFAKASLEEWTFEPQQLNDKPIEGEYQLRMRLNTLDDKPQDFRQDKFQKILNSR